jgi:hypothetical protein
VAPDANADDSGEGWLTAGDLPPPKARIALMLGLAAGLSGDSLRSAGLRQQRRPPLNRPLGAPLLAGKGRAGFLEDLRQLVP